MIAAEISAKISANAQHSGAQQSTTPVR